MIQKSTLSDVTAQYTAAHRMHYGFKNLEGALSLYKDIMNTYPDSKEAGYCRSQILHIVNETVPKENLLDAQIKMAKELWATKP